MNLYIFLLSILNVSIVHAGYLELNINHYSEGDKKYLSSLPKLSDEIVRWNIPSNYHGYIEEYLMKGKFFTIELGNEKLQEWKAKIHSNKSLNDTNPLVVQPWVYSRNGFPECKRSLENVTKTVPKYAECTQYFCSVINEEREIVESAELSYKMVGYDFGPKAKACKIQLSVIGGHRGEHTTINFPFKNIDASKDYLEVQINGINHFLDIKICKDFPKSCYISNFDVSNYERDWIEYKNHRHDSYVTLDHLVAKLLPCVIKKDKACVSKFFISKYEVDQINKIYSEVDEHNTYSLKYSTTIIDDQLLSELKTCLKKESMLPHGLGSKGIEKVCIFSPFPGYENKLISVTYPEAVVTKSNSTFSYVEIK